MHLFFQALCLVLISFSSVSFAGDIQQTIQSLESRYSSARQITMGLSVEGLIAALEYSGQKDQAREIEEDNYGANDAKGPLIYKATLYVLREMDRENKFYQKLQSDLIECQKKKCPSSKPNQAMEIRPSGNVEQFISALESRYSGARQITLGLSLEGLLEALKIAGKGSLATQIGNEAIGANDAKGPHIFRATIEVLRSIDSHQKAASKIQMDLLNCRMKCLK